MKLLLLNTCGAEGVVAVAEGDLVEARTVLPGRGTSEHLMPAIRRVLAERNWRVTELGAIAVVTGPGSFTGMRVGLSAAKGLCEAGAVPMIAISRLALVAEADGIGGEKLALLDAGRGEYYGGVYFQGVPLMEELFRRDQVEELLEGRAGFTCEPQVAAAFPNLLRLVKEPGAEEIVVHALRRVTAGEWSDVASIDANYLRRTDAELLARQTEHAKRGQ